jgi:putative transposase
MGAQISVQDIDREDSRFGGALHPILFRAFRMRDNRAKRTIRSRALAGDGTAQGVDIPGYVGTIKGRTAIRVLNQFRELKQKPYWGNHFWARGYCVDTVGLDAEMIRKYVKYQEVKERESEQPKY